MTRKTRHEEMVFGGHRWRITLPKPSTCCRLYAGCLSSVGSGAISSVFTRLADKDTKAQVANAEQEEAEEYAASRALEILRQVHLGRAIAKRDFGTLLCWLAPSLSGCCPDKLAYWRRELFSGCKLEYYNEQEKKYGALPEDPTALEANLDSLLDGTGPEILFRMHLWALLFVARPSCAG